MRKTWRTIRDCLVKEFVIVLFSPAAVPALWPRSLWEPVLLESVRESNTQVAYVMLENCAFPPFLRRDNFFDCKQDANALRIGLRRWAIQRMEAEWSALVVPVESGSAAARKNRTDQNPAAPALAAAYRLTILL
jgi:hypothetical protein